MFGNRSGLINFNCSLKISLAEHNNKLHQNIRHQKRKFPMVRVYLKKNISRLTWAPVTHACGICIARKLNARGLMLFHRRTEVLLALYF